MILSYLRVAYRAPIVLAWSLCCHWFIRARQLSFPKKYGPGSKAQTGVIGFWGKGLCWIMGLRITRKNDFPEPMGDLIVANHMGFLDVPALLSVFPAVFVIKMEMRRVPYFGRALSRGGHVFVERGALASQRSAAAGIRDRLASGDRIIVFPEGRASPGADRLPFRAFSMQEASRQDKTVQMCVVDYLPDRKSLEWDISKPMLPQVIKLLGRHRTHVSLEFRPAEVPNDGRETAEHYKTFAEDSLRETDLKRERALTSSNDSSTVA